MLFIKTKKFLINFTIIIDIIIYHNMKFYYSNQKLYCGNLYYENLMNFYYIFFY